MPGFLWRDELAEIIPGVDDVVGQPDWPRIAKLIDLAGVTRLLE